MPTKCTRVLAHLFVVGHTSFQNTVSFPLSFGEPCLMLPIFRSLFAHCPWWGVCLQPLKMLFVSSFHFLNFFFFFHNPLFPSLIVKPAQGCLSDISKGHNAPLTEGFQMPSSFLSTAIRSGTSTFCQISLVVRWSFC